MVKLMTALLRLERKGECGIARDIQRADMVHLDRDFESHDFLAIRSCGKSKDRFRANRSFRQMMLLHTGIGQLLRRDAGSTQLPGYNRFIRQLIGRYGGRSQLGGGYRFIAKMPALDRLVAYMPAFQAGEPDKIKMRASQENLLSGGPHLDA
ncbi:hypothetical protein N2384_01420 [Bacillus paralicheniformis]|uniref:hypothetical protein n=1 Tax=Bacillus paralicheniformis TaxID=1648923 RepID=UPI0021A30795|nr:hypothetical protein [Bacillus paralicheniformis]UWS61930.1 hypothetical protein N2384_01420 [Bacillus paralicheniformis]